MSSRLCRCLAVGSLLLCVVSITSVRAQLPEVVSYQGKLAEADSAAVPDGVYSLTFSFWRDAVGGFPTWTEVHPAVDVRNGVFSVKLGESSPLLGGEFASARYLEIQVGAEDPLARQLISAAPYAMAANQIDVGGVDSAAIVDGTVQAIDVGGWAVDGSKVLDGTLLPEDMTVAAYHADCTDPVFPSGGWYRVCSLPPLTGLGGNHIALAGARVTYEFSCSTVNAGQEVSAEVELHLDDGAPFGYEPTVGRLLAYTIAGESVPESVSLSSVFQNVQDGMEVQVRVSSPIADGGCGTAGASFVSAKVWLILLGRQ